MIILSVEHLKKSFGAEMVLDDIHFDIQDHERIGLIGRNGAGKSTIFRIICGQEPPTDGFIHRAKGIQIGYLEQIPQYPEGVSVQEALMFAFKDLTAMRKRLRSMELDMAAFKEEALQRLMHDYDELQKCYETGGGYEIDEKMSRIVTGLKLEGLLTQPFETLSGGEKTRAMLGRLLLETPDLLLLDEPTNHLDVTSVEWLEGYLSDYRGSVVIVSHDRYFLDRTVEKIVEIERMTSRIWPGNYSDYMSQKDAWLAQQLKAYQNQQKKIRAMEEAIARFRQWGENGDNEAMFVKARSMEKRIDRLDKVEKPTQERRLGKLAFESSGRSGKEVLVMEDISAGYEGQALFKSLNMDVRYRDRIALVGDNGTGKSTLFKIILGELAPMMGAWKTGSRVSMGYLAQDIVFDDEEQTVLGLFNNHTGYGEGVCRNRLARFLFIGEDVFKRVDALSGGEKVRLKLCLMMESGVNFLLMDEPTNHVDIPSREMLELALENFEGTVLFISHDRYLIDRIATRIEELTPTGLIVHTEGYGAYRAVKSARVNEAKGTSDNKAAKNYRDSDERRIRNAEKKRAKQLESVERELAEKEVEISDLESELQSDSLPYESLLKRYDRLSVLKKEYDILMETWMELQA